MIIAPSVLSMEFIKMKTQLEAIESSKATWLHFDVMDGHFVPNLSFGPDLLRQFKQQSTLFMDVHIMVSDPHFFAPLFIEAGADMVTFHLEATNHIEAVIQLIRSKGKKVGLSLKPKTDIRSVFPYLKDLDCVLIMSVEPGFGGQAFIQDSVGKIQRLKEEIQKQGLNTLIEVDGGINASTAKLVLDAGADVLVAGSYIFKQDIHQAVDSLWIK